MTKKANVLILGNGFDLRQELKTKYTDFIECGIGESLHFDFFKQIKRDLSWVDVEQEIEGLHAGLSVIHEEIFRPYSHGDSDYYLNLKKVREEMLSFRYGSLIMDLYFKVIHQETNDGHIALKVSEKEYTDFYVDLKKDYGSFVIEFKKYISDIEKTELKTGGLEEIIRESVYCINYNYTDTVRNFGYDGPVKFIHGYCGGDDIVLGVPRNMCPDSLMGLSKEVQVIKGNHTLLESDINEMEDEITGKLRDNELGYLSGEQHLYVLGHSLGRTDWHTLKKFIGSDYFNCTHIYYHDKSSKTDLIVNVLKMLPETGQELIEAGNIKFEKYE